MRKVCISSFSKDSMHMRKVSVTGISGSLIMTLSGVEEDNSQVKGAQCSSFKCKFLNSMYVSFGESDLYSFM